MASHCRQMFSTNTQVKGSHWIIEADAVYKKCVEAHLQSNHIGVMTRMIAGETCGGSVKCNAANEKLPPMTSVMVAKALNRMASGAIIYLGITEEWK